MATTTNTKTVNTTGVTYNSTTNVAQNWIEVAPAGANIFAIQDNTLSASIKVLGSGDTIYIEGNFADYQFKQNSKTITLDNGIARVAVTLSSMTNKVQVTTTLVFLDGSVTLTNKAGGTRVSMNGFNDNDQAASQVLTSTYKAVVINANDSNTAAATYFTTTDAAALVDQQNQVLFTAALEIFRAAHAETQVALAASIVANNDYHTTAAAVTDAQSASVAEALAEISIEASARYETAAAKELLVATELTRLAGLTTSTADNALAVVATDEANAAVAQSALSTEHAIIDEAAAEAVLASYPDPAANFALTTNIDTFVGVVGGNNTINSADDGSNATWTGLDSITVTGTNNTFNIATLQNIANPAGSVVTGVQTMNVTQGGATQTITLNTTAFTGLTQLSVDNIGTGLNTLTASATTNVTDIQNVGGSSAINGGLNVSVTKAQTALATSTPFGAITVGATTAAAGTVTVTNTDTNAAFATPIVTAITVTGGNGVTITDTLNSKVVVGGGLGTVSYTQKGSNGAVVINNNTNVTTTGAAITLIGNAVTVFASATTTDAGATSITVNNTATASQVAVTPSTVTQGVVTITGGTATTAVTVNQTSTATAAATVAAVAGVKGVTAVAAAPGVTGVTAVTAVTAVAAVTGKAGVVAGQVVIADVNGSSGTVANTLATVSLAAIGTNSSITSSALTTLNLSGVSTSGATLAITDNLTSHVSTNVLALNTTAATGDVVITAAKVATLNITNSGTSVLGAFTDTNLTAVTVAGSGVITLGANSATTETVTGAVGVIQTINNTVVTFNAAGTTGTSTITTSTAGTKVITAGSGGLDKLILTVNNTYTTTTGGKFVGFEQLGLGASITQDASVFGAGINVLDITTAGQTSVITKLNANASINLSAAATITTSLTVGYVDTTGSTDSTTITFAGSTGAAQTISTLVLADANGVGVGTINIVDNNVAFNYAGDNIDTLTDNNVSNLNFSGTGGFTLGATAWTNNATSMTIGNTGTNTAGAIVTMTDNSLGNLTFTGTGTTTLNLTDSVAGTLNVTNSGTGAVTIAAGTLSAVNLNLTGAMTFTAIDNNVTSLALSANQAVTFTDSNATGITVSGAADHSRVELHLTGSTAASSIIDNIILGNGNNVVVDAEKASTVNVTVGTGSNVINLGHVTANTTGAFNITLGTHTLASGPDFMTVGTGGTAYATAANYIITGSVAGDRVTFGAEASATDLVGTGLTAGVGTLTATSTASAANAAAAIALIATAADAAHGVAYGVYGGNTYVSQAVTATEASTNNTTIELIGAHTFTADGNNYLVLAS